MHKTAVCSIAVGVMLLADSPAWAQSAPASAGADDAIIVTAQKRAQNIQDIGIAITAIGTQGLASLGQRDVSALVQQVPSMQVTQYASTATIFNIRGISQADTGDGHEAPIAFYNDEVYIAAPGAVSGQNFDLERVEVLRGPQGTLFGRNATGGLVQVVTARPTDDLTGYVTLKVGSRSQIASEAAVSGPLAEGVRARLSMTTNYNDGYVKNTLGGPNGNNSHFYAGRAQLEFDTGASGRLRLKAEYLRNDHETTYLTHQPASIDADGLGVPLPSNVDFWSTRPDYFGFVTPCPGCDKNGFKPTAGFYGVTADTRGVVDRKYWSLTANYEQDLDFATLTSITNYQDLKKIYIVDSDMSPLPLFDVDTSQKLYQYSQELRLSNSEGRFKWVAGAYALKIKSDNFNRLGVPPTSFFPFWSIQNYTQNTRSFAVFGQGEYALTDMFSLIVGGRYTWDRKTENWVKDWQRFGPVMHDEFNTMLNPDLAEIKYDDYSGKVELDFKPNDDTLIYASINRGIKGGGFSTQAFFTNVADKPYGAERLTSYEGGVKLSLADRKLTVNGAGFYYDYKGYQAFTRPRAGETIVSNQPAKLSGVELEVHARPFEGFTFSTWATHLFKKEVKGIVLPLGRVADREMPQAPDWSVGATAAYTVAAGPGDLMLWTNWKYDSSQFFTAFDSLVMREKARIVGDVRVSYTIDNVEASLFVNNVTDKRYRLFALDLALDQGSASNVPAPPRWWGASITYRFGR